MRGQAQDNEAPGYAELVPTILRLALLSNGPRAYGAARPIHAHLDGVGGRKSD